MLDPALRFGPEPQGCPWFAPEPRVRRVRVAAAPGLMTPLRSPPSGGRDGTDVSDKRDAGVPLTALGHGRG
jgi:hypothetical protein